MRLAKYLAHAGVASRRAAEEIIREGRVAVGGRIVTDPAFDVDDSSGVVVDDVPLLKEEKRVVFALNKPAGVVATAQDTHGRPTVVQMIREEAGRLYPVGRLDADSTGLILLTNDGELAHRLTHPKFEVEKTYSVRVGRGRVSDPEMRQLREGVVLDDGRTAPAKVRRRGSDTLEITIHEGRKRQVKRMCDAIGHPVKELRRIQFGPLLLGDLAVGRYRRLGPGEIEDLRRAGDVEASPTS